ncbi:hypothetical protein ABT294_09420 [Nonomuraea sp. NPDC000554]|uniref:hypothetical protein n=1 Tax=Nonomuraea sp. NPDC000554 TaxID=3154259 RepID=UPI0033273D4B
MASPEATPTAVTRSKRWKVVEAPKLLESAGLVDVIADGPRRAWAVGYEDGAEDRAGLPFVERWDGSVWKKVTPRAREQYVNGFDMDGPDDIWLVGDEAAHWDGRRWSYSTPAESTDNSWLTDVSIDGGRAVVVGTDWADDTSFAVEWTGRRFEKRAAVPGVFAAVTARRGQVWVVGTDLRNGCSGIRPAVWHAARGAKYTQMPLPDVPGGYLNQVLQISPDDVWAVGGIGGEQTRWFDCRTEDVEVEQPEALVMHWDGSSWQRVAVPGGNGPLESVTASGADDVWAVGADQESARVAPDDEGAVGADQGGAMVALHFDGRTWTREYAYERLLDRPAVTAIPGTSELWVVGTAGQETDYGQDVILRRR